MSTVLPPALGASAARRDAAHVPAQADHRADIEGLRGIAVLSVLAVHAFPQWAPGGFIGVDIFFVLSGFLITGIVLRQLADGRFSLRDFYERRARRILPALLLVLLACLAGAVLLLYPSEAQRIGHHVAAGAAFGSNIALWREAGYFDAASEAKPLLHLWSLGIEGQFYLVWPLVLWLLWRRRRSLAWAVAATMAVSFAFSVAFAASRPTAVFFLPPARAWELLAGAWLAVVCLDRPQVPAQWLRSHLPAAWGRQVPDVLGGAGLAMLALALLLIDRTDQFAGWWALLPTLGTVALLAAGPAAWINDRVLGHSVLRFYGQISYPLYLWHWPLLSFPVVLGMDLDIPARVGVLVASVVLAVVTTQWIERPLRHGGPVGRRVVPALLAGLAMVGLAGLAVQHTNGLLARWPAAVQPVASAEFRFDYSQYRVDRCLLRLEQGPERFADDCAEAAPAGAPLLMLWGDSHAAALYPGVAALLEERRQQSRTSARLAQFTGSRCPPLMPAPVAASRHCDRINADVLKRIEALRPQTVVLAGHWALYGTDPALAVVHMESLRDTIDRLRRLGVQRVVVYGQQPVWVQSLPRVLLASWSATGTMPQYTWDRLDRPALAIDAAVESAVRPSGAVFVSPVRTLCDGRGCLASVLQSGRHEPLSYDDSHLTVAGSRILVQRSHAAWGAID